MRSADGQVQTVMYQFLPPMLLNELQRQQHTIAAQAAALAEQETEIAELHRAVALLMARTAPEGSLAAAR